MEYLLHFIYDYPAMVDEEHSRHIMEPISPEELKFEVFDMKKDKIPRPDGWPIKILHWLYGIVQARSSYCYGGI